MSGIIFGLALALSPANAVARAFGEATSFNSFCGGNVEEAGGGRYIYATRAAAKCPWAFTEDEVMLACKGMSLIAVTMDGTQWALNGTAGVVLGLRNIKPLWLDDPDFPGTKIDIGPWMEAAKLVCR